MSNAGLEECLTSFETDGNYPINGHINGAYKDTTIHLHTSQSVNKE